jgi:hypothetical protein
MMEPFQDTYSVELCVAYVVSTHTVLPSSQFSVLTKTSIIIHQQWSSSSTTIHQSSHHASFIDHRVSVINHQASRILPGYNPAVSDHSSDVHVVHSTVMHNRAAIMLLAYPRKLGVGQHTEITCAFVSENASSL